ncbi:hypothetical protein NQ318_011325 [Aromia moschata]|uniref:Transposase n=1 Tax=Aromia moschata TaxID=1265417 RepID=A0AAV8XCG2_9CUCU|nr:hypothetical protein NQ318_011325 [Aromia moschata]
MKLHQHLVFLRKVRETCMLMDNRSHPRARPVHTAERNAAVAQSVRENPRTSTRHRAQQLNVSRTSVRRILHKDLGLFAYKLHLTQERRLYNSVSYHGSTAINANWSDPHHMLRELPMTTFL